MQYLHTMVRVKDLDESLDFYCGKLGLVQISRYDSEAGQFTLTGHFDTEQSSTKQPPLGAAAETITITWSCWRPGTPTAPPGPSRAA